MPTSTLNLICVLNVKVFVGACNQEKTLLEAISVIGKLRQGSFPALMNTLDILDILDNVDTHLVHGHAGWVQRGHVVRHRAGHAVGPHAARQHRRHACTQIFLVTQQIFFELST